MNVNSGEETAKWHVAPQLREVADNRLLSLVTKRSQLLSTAVHCIDSLMHRLRSALYGLCLHLKRALRHAEISDALCGDKGDCRGIHTYEGCKQT